MSRSLPPAFDPEELSKKDELDLPPLDGMDDDEEAAADDIDLDDADAEGDALDDATGERDPAEEIAVEGSEGGWLVDADAATGLDVGAFDVAISEEGKFLDAEEHEARVPDDEDLIGPDGESVIVDAGEEGPAADDEELREEDLPALDADDDGSVADDVLYDRAILSTDDELRWDDRAWARVEAALDADDLEPESRTDDSGALVTPGDDPLHGPRDAAWRALDETGRVTAATFLPGGSVVVALSAEGASRVLIVRIVPEGDARIICELEHRPDSGEDDGEPCQVASLRWDPANGWLRAVGSFGVQAFRPA